MITQLKKQLSSHVGSKEARRKIKEIRSTRKWNEKFYENRYVEIRKRFVFR